MRIPLRIWTDSTSPLTNFRGSNTTAIISLNSFRRGRFSWLQLDSENLHCTVKFTKHTEANWTFKTIVDCCRVWTCYSTMLSHNWPLHSTGPFRELSLSTIITASQAKVPDVWSFFMSTEILAFETSNFSATLMPVVPSKRAPIISHFLLKFIFN